MQAQQTVNQPVRAQSGRLGGAVARFIIYVVLIVLAAVCLLPFYSMIAAATHSNVEIATTLPLWFGDQLLNNYHRLMGTINVWRGFLNDLFISVTATVLSLYFSGLTAFGFAKYRFKGNQVLFMILLASMMVPGQLGIIGFFRLMNTFHMLNTYYPLILPSIASAFSVFFFRQVIDDAIPDGLVEAARIDGAGELRIFHVMALPLLAPALATMGIFSFIGNWNSFMMPLIILFDDIIQPLPVMIAMTQNQFSTDYGAQYVGVAISVVPIIILFVVLSRRIIGGLSVGALKG